MLVLFSFALVSVVIVVLLFISHLFEFNDPRPMLEQIEKARINAAEESALAENPIVYTIKV
jgi:uncharacterized protein involved in outer membrane biogenesis